MIGFSAALIIGVIAELSTEVIIWRAMVVMIPCWVVGLLVGTLAVQTVETQVRIYKQARPIPSDYELSSGVDVLEDEDEESDVEVSITGNNEANASK